MYARPLLLDVVFDHDNARDVTHLWTRYPSSNEHYKYIRKWNVCCIRHASFSCEVTKDQIPLLVFRGGQKRFYPCLKALWAIKKLSPDVVLIHGAHNAVRILCLRLLMPQTALVVQHHAEKPASGLKGFLQSFALRRIQAFFFHASPLANAFVRAGCILENQKIFEVPEGSVLMQETDKAQARKALDIPLHQPVFLSVARLQNGKGLEEVIAAFARSSPDGHLYMIYADASEWTALNRLANTCGCGDRIHWVGTVPYHQMHLWYAAADVFVSASSHEGSGFALMEALTYGCFPLVSNIPAYRASIGTRKRVLWLEKGKEHLQMQEAMKLATATKEEHDSSKDFSPESLAEKWESALNRIRKK